MKDKYLTLKKSNLSLKKSRKLLGAKTTRSEFHLFSKKKLMIIRKLKISKRTVFLLNNQGRGKRSILKP